MRTLYKFLRAGVVSALFVQVGFAQKENVGIGTTKPDQSAILDLSSTNKGLLMPRVTLQQRGSIQNPANGLIVYQTDMLSGFYYYDGKDWKAVGAETAQNSVADAFNWGLTGNSGTNPATNFIGTTDNQNLVFKVGGSRAGLLSVDNRTFFGLLAGLNTTAIHNSGFGFRVLEANTTGIKNTGLGSQTLFTNTTGNNNTAVGVYSLLSNTTGNDNVAMGEGALQNNTTGSQNMGIGGATLFSNTTGLFNSGIGYASLLLNTTGSDNIGIGAFSLMNGTAVSNNVAIGSQAGRDVTGSNNVFIGYQAAKSETSVSNKLYISNYNTATPLVYGDFTTKYLAVGEVAAADRAAATSGGYRLLVKGGMITEKIKVAVAGSSDWADYVFEPSYKMMPLESVESFVKTNKHLPNVPSAEEMAKNGLDVMQTSAKLMEKIEELTLYMIEMNKEIKALKKENELLKK